MSTFNMVVLALLAISEVLALIPGVGSNSVFQLIVNILKGIAGRVAGTLGSKNEPVEFTSEEAPKKKKKVIKKVSTKK